MLRIYPHLPKMSNWQTLYSTVASTSMRNKDNLHRRE